MTYRTLCALAFTLLFVAAGGCGKDKHGDDHPHGEGADHAHGEEAAKPNPNPPTRIETVPAAKTGEPAAADAAIAVDPTADDEGDSADDAPAGEHAKGEKKKADHKHGKGDHTH